METLRAFRQWLTAIEVIRGGIVAAPGEGFRWRCALRKEVMQRIDNVCNVELSVVVAITSIGAGSWFWGTKQKVCHEDRVGNVIADIPVTVAANKGEWTWQDLDQSALCVREVTESFDNHH